MEQGKNILEDLQIIKENLETLKAEVKDASLLNKVNKIQQKIEMLQNMLPKKIHQFTTTHYEGYVNWITQIEKMVIELKENLTSIRLDFIIEEISRCKSKASNKFQEKKNKKLEKKY